MDHLILSVMHSGTWFTRQLLKDHGFGNVPTAHFAEGEIPKARQVITPIRHPSAVVGSWVKRGKSMAQLSRAIDEQVSGHGILLPVDSPRRDEYLTALSECLGVELVTDWRKVHCTGSVPVVSGFFDKYRDFYGPIYEG